MLLGLLKVSWVTYQEGQKLYHFFFLYCLLERHL